MRKIALVILTTITLPTYATTMCAANDTVAVVLDPTISPVSGGSNTSQGTWWFQFPYGRVSGISACIDSSHGLSRGQTIEKLQDAHDGVAHLVTGSEKYGYICWCKIIHPVASFWVLDGGRGTECATYCTTACIEYFGDSRGGVFRHALYGTIKN